MPKSTNNRRSATPRPAAKPVSKIDGVLDRVIAKGTQSEGKRAGQRKFGSAVRGGGVA
jgi:hypothetical protein